MKEESKYNLASRNIFLNIKKKSKGPYWPRLTKSEQKLNWLSIDWQYFVDEDEEDEDTNMPRFGNEQSFPGFGADDDLPDEDDEVNEHVHGDNCSHDKKGI